MPIREKSGKCDYCNKESTDTEMHFCQPGIDVELCARCWRLGPIGALLGEDWKEQIKKGTSGHRIGKI